MLLGAMKQNINNHLLTFFDIVYTKYSTISFSGCVLLNNKITVNIYIKVDIVPTMPSRNNVRVLFRKFCNIAKVKIILLHIKNEELRQKNISK